MNRQGIGVLLLRSGRGGPLRHALAYAADIRRDCVVNGGSCAKFASLRGLDEDQVVAAKWWLEECRDCPPPEVCAGVASLDPGLDDADIAEMFGRSEKWAKMARERREEFCAEANVPLAFEPWVKAGDPAPEQIWRVGMRPKKKPSQPRSRSFRPRSPG